MVTAVIDGSTDSDTIAMTEEVAQATAELRDFLFKNVYLNPIAKSEDEKAQELLYRLFEYYEKYPEKMPALFYRKTEKESVKRCVCDYVSGMTDRYAIDLYKKLFIPSVWSVTDSSY